MNQELIAKLGWRMLNERGSLWSKTLLRKHGGGRKGFRVFEHKQGASHI